MEDSNIWTLILLTYLVFVIFAAIMALLHPKAYPPKPRPEDIALCQNTADEERKNYANTSFNGLNFYNICIDELTIKVAGQ